LIALPLFEIARVLVRLFHIARLIVNAITASQLSILVVERDHALDIAG